MSAPYLFVNRIDELPQELSSIDVDINFLRKKLISLDKETLVETIMALMLSNDSLKRYADLEEKNKLGFI